MPIINNDDDKVYQAMAIFLLLWDFIPLIFFQNASCVEGTANIKILGSLVHDAMAKAIGWGTPTQGSNPVCGTLFWIYSMIF
jgi:hypothetical protein